MIRLPKSELFVVIFLFTGLFILYAYTAPRVIALYDDGQFILNSYFLSPTYPPGYPLYILLSHLAVYLPLGSVAYRIHLVSALFGALTCVSLWFFVQRLTKDKGVAIMAAVGFGVSRIFWAEAIIAKCYTLQSWLFFSMLALSLKIYQERDDQGQVFYASALFFLLFGMALSNHWPFTILYGIIFPYFFWNARKLIFRHMLWFLLFLVIGLSPYLWMWWRGQQHLAINAVGLLPFESFGEFISYLRRDIFSQIDHDEFANVSDKMQFIFLSIREWFTQYTPLGLIGIFLGIGYAWRNYERGLMINLILGWFIPQIVILAKIDFSADYFKMNIFKHYPMISYGLAAMWLGLGIKVTLEKIFVNRPNIYRQISAGVILVWIFFSNVTINNRSSEEWTKRYAQNILQLIPDQARVIVGGENNAAILGYYHLIERLRPDVTLYEDTNFFYNLPFASAIKAELQAEYLAGRGDLSQQRLLRKKIADFIDASDRPLIIINASSFSELLDQVNPTYGILAQILTNQQREHYTATIFDQSHIVALEKLINSDQDIIDPWIIVEQARLIRTYHYLTVCLNYDSAWRKKNIDDPLAPFFAELGTIEGYLMCQNNLEQATQHLELARKFLNSEIERKTRAEYYKYRGEVRAVRLGIDGQVIQDFITSLQIYPSPDNLSLRQLLKIYAMLGAQDKFYATARKYITGTTPNWYGDLAKILADQKRD